ncbi:MAG: hypothetical protein H0X31_00875 [Nostocaceae cyanobacterium]|nr:hypothetical protein [Nostocaceae cyanobacterium]
MPLFPGSAPSVQKIFFVSGAPINVTGATSSKSAAAILGTIVIPAGSCLPNSLIRVEGLFSYTNSSSSKNLGLRVGTVNIWQNGSGFAGNDCALIQRNLILRGLNSQVCIPTSNYLMGAESGVPPTFSFDFSQTQTIQFQAWSSVATDRLSLEYGFVEILY